MRRWQLLVAAAVTATAAAPVSAQRVEERVLPALVGGAAGVAGGGYVALSVVVAQARAGNYLHEFQELFGWRSLPVIAGGAMGTALGVYSPARLERAILWGFGGMAAGGALGLGVGQLIWRAPEGKWAGMAIGAGAGLALAYVAGAITATNSEDLGGSGESAGLVIPLGFTVRTR
jgi:hypothetical protein